MAENAPPPPEPAPPPAQPASPPPAPRKPPAGWRTGAARARRAPPVVTAGAWRKTLLAGALLALTGAAIGWLLNLRPTERPVFRAIVVSQYGPGQPARPFAERDREALRTAFGGEAPRQFEVQQAELVRLAITELRELAASRLVVYVRSLATCRDGKVYLLTAPGGGPAGGIPLTDLLAAVDRRGAGRCLLLLDLSAPAADPRRGVPPEDVADGVNGEVAARGDAGALVLCSCKRGQESLPAEPWQLSAFARFVAEGLAGEADGWAADGAYHPDQCDRKVSAAELGHFVSWHVDKWAWDTRRAHQTPRLFGPGAEEFIVAFTGDAPADKSADDKPADELPAYPGWLLENWQLRDRWRAGDTFRYCPRAFRALEVVLARADECWRHGDTVTAETYLRPEAAKLQAPVADAEPRLRAAAAPSLAGSGLSADERTAAKESARTLNDLLDGQAAKPDADPSKKKPPELPDAWKKLTPRVRAAAVFLAAVDVPPVRERAASLRELLPRDYDARFAETLLLERIAGWQWSYDEKTWTRDKVTALLLAVQQEEEAAAGDPGAVLAVREALDELAVRRRRLEASPEPDGAGLDRLRGDAADLAGRVAKLGSARAALEEAAVFLPACAPYVAARNDPDLSDAWAKAVAAARDLYGLLGGADAARRSDELAGARNELVFRLGKLRGPFTRDVVGKRLKNPEKPEDLRELLRLSDSPLPAAADRAALTAAVWERAKALGNKDKADAEAPDPNAAAAEAPDPIAAARYRGITRDLLALAGVETAGDAARALRELPARLRREPTEAAVRTGVAVYPFDDLPDERFADPATVVRERELREYRAWLTRRCDAEVEAYRAENYDRNGYKNEPSAAFFRRARERLSGG
jgi:hypothetical protein